MQMAFLLPALLLQAASPVQDEEQAYRDRFDTALIEVCPEAIRTSGASLRDPAALATTGFVLRTDNRSMTIARAIDIEVMFVPGARAVCHLAPIRGDAVADARFNARWGEFAERNYPDVDLASVLAGPQWIPPPIHVTDNAPRPNFLMIMGHVSARGDIPETYVISVMAPPAR